MNFANAMHMEANKKYTENGAEVLGSSGYSALVDLFAVAGALRPRSEKEIEQKFAAAFAEDALLATKMLFYISDIRLGGLGERRTFRICLKWLANNHPDVVNKNISLIPYYNRFDSWFVLCGTPCESKMWEILKVTILNDMRAMRANAPISLLAKWMPSENTSSVSTRKLARKAITVLGFTPREYRKILSKMRAHINVVERKMSEGNWNDIDYSKVPSYAMHIYGHAFAKHDYERFNKYINSVSKGEAKINSSVMFPYDLVREYTSHGYSCIRCGDGYIANSENNVVEAQWKALPNYITKPINAIVMADVSGSMFGGSTPAPINSSIGLAIYFAQHNVGAFHNKYMTFTDRPSFVEIKENASLYENVRKVMGSGVGYSTNLALAFETVLNTAIAYKIPQNEMPKAIIVISDMEINKYRRESSCWNFVKNMKIQFNRAGYTMPKCIMWNVAARQDTFLAEATDDVIFVSGQSASTFKDVCNNLDTVNAIEYMLKVLNRKEYSLVKV